MRIIEENSEDRKLRKYSKKRYTLVPMPLKRALIDDDREYPTNDRDEKKKLMFSWRKEIFEEFKKVCKEDGIDLPKKRLYNKILQMYFTQQAENIIFKSRVFILPYGLGRLYLKKSRRVGFKKNNKRKVYRNFHSFRHFFQLKWDLEMSVIKNRTIWRWKTSDLCRKMIRRMATGKVSPLTGNKALKGGGVGHGFNETKWT